MSAIYKICPRCNRSILPDTRIEEKGNKRWLIYYCPYTGCAFNLDLKQLLNDPPTNKNPKDFNSHNW